MSHIEEDSFDRQIRSAMENAEEPVPEHLWPSISGRLDAADALAARRLAILMWLRRGAVGLAAAAAVLLGVFLFRPNAHPDISGDAAVAVVTPSVGDSASAAEDLPSKISSTPDYIAQTIENKAHDTAIDKAPAHGGDKGAASVSGTGSASDRTWGNGAAAGDIDNETGQNENDGAAAGDTENEAGQNGDEGGMTVEDILAEMNKASAGAAGARPAEEKSISMPAETPETEPSDAEPSSWEEALAQENGGGRRKVRTAIVMSGNAMSNAGNGSSSAYSGFNRQLSSSIVQQITPGVSQSSESSFSIPASFGLGVKIIFTPRWSLGVGVNYSLLSRTFSGTYTSYSEETDSYSTTNYSKIRHNASYIGIPVNAYFSIVKSHIVDFYAYAGGTAEKLVGNRYVLEDDGLYKDSTKGFQFSADLGVGVEFLLADMVGLYIDPSIRYYFPNGSLPTTIRSQEPFTFGFEIGFRIRL